MNDICPKCHTQGCLSAWDEDGIILESDICLKRQIARLKAQLDDCKALVNIYRIKLQDLGEI